MGMHVFFIVVLCQKKALLVLRCAKGENDLVYEITTYSVLKSPITALFILRF